MISLSPFKVVKNVVIRRPVEGQRCSKSQRMANKLSICKSFLFTLIFRKQLRQESRRVSTDIIIQHPVAFLWGLHATLYTLVARECVFGEQIPEAEGVKYKLQVRVAGHYFHHSCNNPKLY